MNSRNEFRLGEHAETLAVNSAEELRTLISSMVGQARRSVCIFDRDLDVALYHSSELVQAMRRLMSAEANAQIKILIHDVERALHNVHEIFQLGHRTPSHLQIRKSPLGFHHRFLVVDAVGVIDHRMGTGYDYEVNFNSAGKARSLLDFFNDVWNKSKVPTEIRNLSI